MKTRDLGEEVANYRHPGAPDAVSLPLRATIVSVPLNVFEIKGISGIRRELIEARG